MHFAHAHPHPQQSYSIIINSKCISIGNLSSGYSFFFILYPHRTPIPIRSSFMQHAFSSSFNAFMRSPFSCSMSFHHRSAFHSQHCVSICIQAKTLLTCTIPGFSSLFAFIPTLYTNPHSPTHCTSPSTPHTTCLSAYLPLGSKPLSIACRNTNIASDTSIDRKSVV